MTEEDAQFLADMQRLYPRNVKVGKEGIVRLKETAMDALRQLVYTRDKGRCVTCGCRVRIDVECPDWHPLKYDLSHLKNKRMYGDLPSNTACQCHRDHMDHHDTGAPIYPAEHAGKLSTAITDGL